METSFNIIEVLSYFHYFYLQLLFKQYKNHRIRAPIRLFSLYALNLPCLFVNYTLFLTFLKIPLRPTPHSTRPSPLRVQKWNHNC